MKLFFSMPSVMLTWRKILINGNVMLTSNLGWNWSHAIFLKFLDESFCFLPRLSGLSTVWNSLYFFTMVRKVETGTKNCLNMALYLFQFLWASTIRVQIRTELFSRHADSQCCWKTNVNFCANEKTQLRATDKIYSARIINIIWYY